MINLSSSPGGVYAWVPRFSFAVFRPAMLSSTESVTAYRWTRYCLRSSRADPLGLRQLRTAHEPDRGTQSELHSSDYRATIGRRSSRPDGRRLYFWRYEGIQRNARDDRDAAKRLRTVSQCLGAQAENTIIRLKPEQQS